MKKKKNKSTYRQEVETFVGKAKELEDTGYVVLSDPYTSFAGESLHTQISETYGGGKNGLDGIGPVAAKGSEMFRPNLAPLTMAEGRGAIPWGADNRLPLYIYQSAKALPYTASGLRYLVDLTCGLGVKVMYRYAKVVGDDIKENFIPYEDAGVMLRKRIRMIRQQLADSSRKEGERTAKEQTPPNIFPVKSEGSETYQSPDMSAYRTKKQEEPVNDPLKDFNEDTAGSWEEELKIAIEDYKQWKTAEPKITEFMQSNDINDHFQRCMTDNITCDLYFSTVGLNQGKRGDWDAKIVSIGHIPVVAGRFEKKDENQHINNIYYCEAWRNRLSDGLTDNKAVMYPVLGALTEIGGRRDMVGQLKEYVKQNIKTAPSERKMWFCIPTAYPSVENTYYPLPHWWSVYSSLVFMYAFTYFFDKAYQRQNATMWGKIIYINQNYLQRIYSQYGIKERSEMEAYRNKLIDTINNFLRQRQNNGKTVALDSYADPDMKELVKSIEILDVPQPKTATASSEELNSISSTIAHAMGIHSALLGDHPGMTTTSGGTFQRELHLLKQNQMAPRQRAYIRHIENIFAFNNWDPKHAKVTIVMPILTTLDNSKTGTTETNIN